MNESELRRQIESVRRGTLPRRGFVERLAAFGIGAPMAWLLLADAGVAQPSSAPPYKPTKRGGGGPLRVLLWQAPTLLNPHFATGTKDELGAQVFYDALARDLPVSDALRAAKLDALARGTRPNEWAVFTAVGDPLVRVPLRKPPLRRIVSSGAVGIACCAARPSQRSS